MDESCSIQTLPFSCIKMRNRYQNLLRNKSLILGGGHLTVENFSVYDEYSIDYTSFSVCGMDIRVFDDELAEALKKLPERKRNTLLMYYFLEMTESEIANLQKITQSGVFRNRHHALETMKKLLREEM